ncbi:unnamed protein product [Ilex paraguariensis]|uniref:Uncharacterized protein n=1 Tax=Ilex paraguariensis TaxID=185542 RepID=A0ABC8V1L7_9AQUA
MIRSLLVGLYHSKARDCKTRAFEGFGILEGFVECGSMDGNGGSCEMGTVGIIDFGPPTESVVDLTGKVHQLPCCIKYDGPCSVSDYFKPKPTGIEVDGLKIEEAYFRGRKLQGTTIPLPEGYSGNLLLAHFLFLSWFSLVFV